MIAWHDGDEYALHSLLSEAMNDPIGVPGLLFESIGFATEWGTVGPDNFREQLQAAILHHQQDPDEQDQA